MTLCPSINPDRSDVSVPELENKDTTESNTSASYLDLLLSIGNDGHLRTSFYDKRDYFNSLTLQTFRSWVATFHLHQPMVFLSHNSSDTPGLAPLMNVLFWARCNFPISFSGRDMSSLRKFYGRYGDLTKQYEVPLSQMLHGILEDNHIQWHPPLMRHYTNSDPLLIWTLLPNLTFYLLVWGVHRTFVTGAACQQRTLTPPST